MLPPRPAFACSGAAISASTWSHSRAAVSDSAWSHSRTAISDSAWSHPRAAVSAKLSPRRVLDVAMHGWVSRSG
nr:unnamed protein product [Digitaria exilis]